jgi:hypothetical protein
MHRAENVRQSAADAAPLADGGFLVIRILFTEHTRAATKP